MPGRGLEFWQTNPKIEIGKERRDLLASAAVAATASKEFPGEVEIIEHPPLFDNGQPIVEIRVEPPVVGDEFMTHFVPAYEAGRAAEAA